MPADLSIAAHAEEITMEAVRREVATVERGLPPAVQGETAAILSMIERAAKDPAIDLDRMERLFAMRESMLKREAETVFNAAMAAAQAEMPRVVRDAVNSHSRSRYARLESIAKAITPVITRHGFSLSFDTGEAKQAGHIRVICTVAHRDGHSRQHFADLPPDTAGSQGNANKTAVQGFGSTVSYGRRYLTLMIFNVALTNEDDDGNGGRRKTGGPNAERANITEDQARGLRKYLESIGGTSEDETRLLNKLGLDSLAQVYADRLKDVETIIRQFGERIQDRQDNGERR